MFEEKAEKLREFSFAADRQAKELTELQESVLVLEEDLERAEQQVRRILTEAFPLAADRQAKELTRLQKSVVVLEDHLERMD